MIGKSEFKNQFQNLPTDFSKPIEFTGDPFGFSVLKEYPNGYASLFKVYIRPEELSKKGPIKTIDGAVSYGKKTSDGIVLSSSSEKIKKLFDPLDLVSRDEFLYNYETHKFFYKGKEITASNVIVLLDKWHLKITKTVQGAWLRLKIIWFHYLLAKFLKIVFKAASGLQYLATGEKVKIFHDLIKDPNESLYPSEKPLDIKKSELIDLWGYKVKPWIAGTYAMLHLFAYFIFFFNDYQFPWLTTLFKNSFLTFMYGIVSLGLANTFLPILFKPIELKKILKFIQSLYMITAFRRVKI